MYNAIISDYSLLNTSYADQSAQTKQVKKLATQYGNEKSAASGDTYTFSAEAMQLAQQMLSLKSDTAPETKSSTDKHSSDKNTASSDVVENKNTVNSTTGSAEVVGEVAENSEGNGGSGGGVGGGSDDSSDSNEDIEGEIAALQGQLQVALSSGDESKASALESEIAALQSQLTA